MSEWRCSFKIAASTGITLLLASWVVVLAKLLVVVWLHYYNKIYFKLIIKYKFKQSGVNQALLSYNRCMAKRSLETTVLLVLGATPKIAIIMRPSISLPMESTQGLNEKCHLNLGIGFLRCRKIHDLRMPQGFFEILSSWINLIGSMPSVK